MLNPSRIEGTRFGSFVLKFKELTHDKFEILIGLEGVGFDVYAVGRLGRQGITLRIRNVVSIGGTSYALANTRLERDVLTELFRAVPSAHIVLVDLLEHEDVVDEVLRGAPPEVTRIGAPMVLAGLSHIRVQYCEPFIFAEKPESEQRLAEYLSELSTRIEEFIASYGYGLPRAFERALELMFALKKMRLR